jgi:hypothetical protein
VRFSLAGANARRFLKNRKMLADYGIGASTSSSFSFPFFFFVPHHPADPPRLRVRCVRAVCACVRAEQTRQ